MLKKAPTQSVDFQRQPDKKILITGATGFVGSYLVRYLLQYGYHNIYCLRRANSPMDLVEEVKDRVHWLEGDILDIPFLETAMEGVDHLYHAAAVVSFHPEDRKWMWKVNVEGTSNVMNIAQYREVEKFVHLSSVAAIGRQKDGEKISERTKWQRGPLNTQYAVSKYLAEQEAWRSMAEGMEGVILNPSTILGSGYWDKSTGILFKRVWDGLRFVPVGGTGFVDVRDVARLCIQLMESNISQERLIANGENWTYADLFQYIAQQLDRQPPRRKVPPFMARWGARVLRLLSLLSNSRPSLTLESARTSSSTFYYENEKSIQQLNFNYLPIHQTIEETCSILQKGPNHVQPLPLF